MCLGPVGGRPKIDADLRVSQGWLIFLRNHAPTIAAMDLFVVPTIGFDLLYVLVIVRLARRDLVWINVTPNTTAEWIARQAGRGAASYGSVFAYRHSGGALAPPGTCVYRKLKFGTRRSRR
jgi:hypothetical protein